MERRHDTAMPLWLVPPIACLPKSTSWLSSAAFHRTRCIRPASMWMRFSRGRATRSESRSARFGLACACNLRREEKMPTSEVDKRELIARRVAQELRDGNTVNLGIGMPTRRATHILPGTEVLFQSENGMLGMGPFPLEGEEDADLVNAGKETVSEIPGSSYFSSSDSFAMIRGGHAEFSGLGGVPSDEQGHVANMAGA